MTATTARIGYGSTVEVSTDNGDNWVEIDEVSGLTPPAFALSNPVATHMQSPGRAAERIPGMLDMGQTSFTINWLPGSAADVALRGLATGFTKFLVRETFPNGAYWTIGGLLANFAPQTPLDDRMSAEVTIDVTGAVTVNAAAAPVNSLLPAISGVAQVGQTLHAWPGQWSGGPTFTYVWKNEGVAINGATAQTYELAAGDQGDNITVTVTATNSAGSASATSAETVAIAAA